MEYVKLERSEYEQLVKTLRRAIKVAEAWRDRALELERKLRRLERREKRG